MSRIAFILFALFAFTLVVAAPVPIDETELAKRVNHSGRGTFFYPGLGNCGYTDTKDDPIIAISTDIYGSGGNCNQWVHITDTSSGKTAYGKVRDSCPSCASGSLDMSPDVFKQLAALSVGDIPIEWHYMAKGWSP